MKKTLRSILTLLLVVAMLFGVMAPTVAYATSGTGSGSGTGNSGTGSVGGSYDAGWCIIEYDANELKITLDPDKESILDMDKEKVKEMLNTVIDAAKTIALDELKEDIKDGIFGSDSSGGLDSNTDINTVWKGVIDLYLASVPELQGFSAEERYLEFFKAALESPENEDKYINELIDYACDLVENAVRFGMFTVEELENFGEAKIRETVDNLFKDQVEELLKIEVDKYVDVYAAWLLGPEGEDLDLDEEIEDFINEEVENFLAHIADEYISGTLDKSTYIYNAISEYVDAKLETFAKNALDRYVATNGQSGEGAEVDGWIADEIENIIYTQFAEYIDYMAGVTTTAPTFYNEIREEVIALIGFETNDRAVLELEIYQSTSPDYVVRPEVYDDAVAILFDAYEEDNTRFGDLVDDIVDEVLSDTTRFAAAVEDEVEEILSAGNAIKVLREILADVNNDTDTIVAQIKDEIIERTDFNVDAVVPGSFTDRVFELVLGVGHDDFYHNRLPSYVDMFIVDYNAMLYALKNEDQTVSVKDLIKYLEGIHVGVHGETPITVYGDFGNGYTVSTEGILDLLKTLPTPAELKNMDDVDMCWSYDFYIVTEFGSCDFTITLDLEGGFNTVRKVAGLIDDYLDVYISSDGYYTVNLRVPARFSDLLLRACKTGRVSEATKNKIFSLLTYNVDDAYGLYNDKVTFENIIDLLEEINFEGLLDKEFVSQFVDLSGLSNEDIVNKVKEYEGYFNKFNSIVSKIYNRIPDQYRDNEIMDYYGEDGLFGYKNTHTISYEKIEKAIMKALPGYGATILSFFDIGDSVTAKVDLSLDFEDVNKIEYSLPGASEPYRVGLLPVGADVEMFAEMTEYNGKEICYWVEIDEFGNQTIVTTMPDKDVTLYPVIIGDVNVSVEKPDETEKVYNGEPIRLSIDVSGYTDYDSISFAWYKVAPVTFSLRRMANPGDQLVATTPDLDLTNVSDSGSYYYVVTVTKGDVTEEYSNIDNPIPVNIQPIELDLGTLTWNETVFDYDGTEKQVNITNAPDYIVITLGGTIAAIGDPDQDCSYVATATWALADGLVAENYLITGTIADNNWKIVITPIDNDVVIPDDLVWNYDTPLVYTGSEQSVELVLGTSFPTGVEVSYELDLVNGITNKATDAGTYVAKAVFTSTEGKNVVCNTAYELTWKILPKTAVIDTLTWIADGTLVYDGTAKTVTVTETFEGITVSYQVDDDFTNTATNAGTYTAKVVFTPESGNYAYDLRVSDEYSWTIAPQEIVFTTNEYTWNYTVPFIYNGTEFEVALNESVPANVRIVYTGVTSAINAGTYTADAYFEVTDSNYIISVQPTVDELEWTVSPMTVTLADIVWNYTAPFTYSGLEQTVYVVGLPTGLSVSYSGTTAATNVGSYRAVANLTVDDGYEGNFIVVESSAALDWQIDKLVIDLSQVDWDYTDALVFNKAEQTVGLAGLPAELEAFLKKEGYTVVLEGNKAINAGVYTATARLIGVSDNCDAVGFSVPALEWTILKADFDMSGVSFPDMTVHYTGEDITVGIIGADKLPAGVVVSYTADTTYRYMGRYVITAVFTLSNPNDALVNFNNYNEIPSMTMVLTILTELEDDFVYRDDAGIPVLSVKAENGVPKDHEFKVTDDSHVYSGFFITDDRYGRVVSAYDISFTRGGVYMYVTDNFEVKLLIPEDYRDSEDLTIVYVKENGDVEELQGERVVEGSFEYMVFTTGHFSTYALVNIEDAPVKEEPVDYSWIWILVVILVILVLLALVILLIVIRRRKNKGDEPKPTDPEDKPEGGDDEPKAEEPTEEPKTEEPKEEAPAEEPEIVIVIDPTPAEEPTEAPETKVPEFIPVGETVPVRYRHSFESKLIQAETEIQDYYTTIKNTLLSYKGVKARMSFNYEAFNKGRIQCAKLNLKGKTLVVYLNLNPADYNVNKYHFVDVSDKIKSDKDKLIMLMKVKSDRALGYTVELIEEMMKTLEIERGETQTVDYHQPYEATEELAKRGLVKVILPAGMILDENSNIVRVNVGELIDSANADKPEKEVSEIPVAVPTVEPVPESVVYADAAEADKLISDEEAEAHVEIVHTGANARKGKLGEINLDTICANYESGETVDLASLKEKRLVGKNIARVKVLARGTMNRSLTVVASKFSMQAIKMIDLAGGKVVIED